MDLGVEGSNPFIHPRLLNPEGLHSSGFFMSCGFKGGVIFLNFLGNVAVSQYNNY